jgi:hypothetical protein
MLRVKLRNGMPPRVMLWTTGADDRLALTSRPLGVRADDVRRGREGATA